MIGEKYRPELVEDHYDSIIIGSGIGGLCVAALLSKSGQKVLVLESHYTAGGFTHTYTRKGFEWDVGLHYVGEVHREKAQVRRIFDYITDYRLKWARTSEIYDRIIIKDKTYDFVAGKENFRRNLHQYFPEEKDAIDRYLKILKQATDSFGNYIAQRAIPPLPAKILYPIMTRSFRRFSDRTTLQVLKRLTDNPELIGVLTGQYSDYGLPPGKSSFGMHALLASHYLDGANYPIGGSSSIAKSILPVIEQAGGKVVVRAKVKRIIIRRGKVAGIELENGRQISAPCVVSNAGIFNTYGTLLTPEWQKRLKVPEKLSKVRPSISHLCLYIGLKQSAEELGLEQTNLWIYPDYHHDAVHQKYFCSEPLKADFPVVYISFPSTKDPEWPSRYPGKSTIEIITTAPYRWFDQWQQNPWRKRGEHYQNFKQKLSESLLKQLYKYVPQVEGKIHYHELSTPLSTRHFCNYQHGEIYGLEHSPLRFRQRWLKPRTPIKGLFLTGQDIATDGIAGALSGGVICSCSILKRNVLLEILKKTKITESEK